MPNPKTKPQPLPDFDRYAVDFDASDRPCCFHLFWNDVEVATVRLEYDASGFLNKAIREGTGKQRYVSLKDLANIPFFTTYIHRINLIDLISNIENIESIDLIDLITKIAEITTIKNIDTISSMPDITVKGSEGIAFVQVAASAGSWVSPTGYDDPDSGWSDETYAYDDDENSYSDSLGVAKNTWTSFLYLTHAAITSNKLQFKIDAREGRYNPVDIDVYKDGVWVHVYHGSVEDYVMTEKTFSQGEVTQMRIRGYQTTSEQYKMRVYEVDFWQVPTTGGELIVAEKEEGDVSHFSKTATANLLTPTAGKKIKVLGAFYYCQDDIVTELRFKTSGNVVLALPTLGSVGMELKRTEILGAVNEVLEIYLSGAGTVKGWYCTSEV
jgi:hypothetical protein